MIPEVSIISRKPGVASINGAWGSVGATLSHSAGVLGDGPHENLFRL